MFGYIFKGWYRHLSPSLIRTWDPFCEAPFCRANFGQCCFSNLSRASDPFFCESALCVWAQPYTWSLIQGLPFRGFQFPPLWKEEDTILRSLRLHSPRVDIHTWAFIHPYFFLPSFLPSFPPILLPPSLLSTCSVLSFIFLGPHRWYMEIPRLWVESELQLLVYATATAMLYPIPTEQARDWTCIPMDTSQVRFCSATGEFPIHPSLCLFTPHTELSGFWPHLLLVYKPKSVYRGTYMAFGVSVLNTI